MPPKFNARDASVKFRKSGFTPPIVYVPHKGEYKVTDDFAVSFKKFKSEAPFGLECHTEI